MKEIITTSAYSKKISQTTSEKLEKSAQRLPQTQHKRYTGNIEVAIYVPVIDVFEVDPTINSIETSDPQWDERMQSAQSNASAMMQKHAEEALKRAAWDLRFKKVDLSLDHELSDPETQADIGEGPLEIDVQMSGYRVTGSD